MYNQFYFFMATAVVCILISIHGFTSYLRATTYDDKLLSYVLGKVFAIVALINFILALAALL